MPLQRLYFNNYKQVVIHGVGIEQVTRQAMDVKFELL
jgi:hypothetical protein